MPSQERGRDLGELLGGLDLCPVPAVREHVQLRLRDQLERGERAVDRVHPVLAPPGQQGVLAQPVGLAPEHPVLGGLGVPERHAHREHRLLRTRRRGVGVPLLDELVGDQLLVDHHRGDERPQRLAAGVGPEVHQPLDALGGVGVEEVEREPSGTHQDQPPDPVGVAEREPHRGAAAEAVAEQVHPLDAELVEQRHDEIGREPVVVAHHRRLVGGTEAGLVDQQGPDARREPGQRRAEVASSRRPRPAAVQHHERQRAARSVGSPAS